jgi:two-component system LytT family response regulator
MIRAIIVDDELAAIGNMADLLVAAGSVQIVGEFMNPLEALEALKDLQPDIAFLDIEMPGIHGMELANRMLDVSGRMKIVFVTAYSEYAIEAFELNATDYLLKPVSLHRLKLTLERATPGQPAGEGERKLLVRCFGKFKVEDEAGRTIKWRTSKTEELFAYLVDKNGKEAGKEQIVEALWSSFDEKRALTNFSTCLYNLRKALKELGWPELIVSSNGMYRLDMEQIISDIQQFESSQQQMHPIDASISAKLDQVIEQCSAGYLELNYYEWAEDIRRLIDDRYSDMIVRLASYYEGQRLEFNAIQVLKKGLLKDPCHSILNKRLMELYISLNDRYAAIKHYEEYRRKLNKELGLEPDSEMTKWRELLNRA